jgi:C4-dicarboxylate-specific signal transduction histidine kinase
VYGREVNDFLSVDYEAIAMLNVSATQELNRRLEAKVAEFTRLGTEKDAQIKALAADNVELQQRVKDIEERDAARAARLATLEKSLNALVAAKSDSTPVRSSGAVAE